jgi:hypothetical protein
MALTKGGYMKYVHLKIIAGAVMGIALSATAAKSPTLSASVSTSKSLNVRVNPLGLAIGSISAEGDFKINEKWTLGPSLSHFSANFFFTELNGWGFGARSNYYLTGNVFEDSWIVGTSVGLSVVNVRFLTEEASSLGVFVNALLGYQWVWKSGLNMQLALGGSWFSQGSEMQSDSGATIDVPFYHGIKPAAEFTVGYVF